MTRGSSCFSDPAAELRGLANTGWPASSRSRLSARNARDRQVDLAAHLEARGQRPPVGAQAERHAADGPQVGRDVLADDAVAARRADGERAVLVHQLDRDAVDLRLDDVLDPLAAEQPAHAGVELLHLVAAW